VALFFAWPPGSFLRKEVPLKLIERAHTRGGYTFDEAQFGIGLCAKRIVRIGLFGAEELIVVEAIL
jgi:hypothetical protein